MFSFIVRTEVQPRWKNGQPAHSTTGVARTSWTQVGRRRGDGVVERRGRGRRPSPGGGRGWSARRATQNRRVMSASSGLGPLSAVTVTGSRAIPQIGQVPGPGRRISGCIGQVHSAPGPSAGRRVGAA